MRSLNIYSLSNFHIYNTVLLIIVAMLCDRYESESGFLGDTSGKESA